MRALEWRLRQQFELNNRLCALTVSSAEAVCARIAATDNHDISAVGADEIRFRDLVALAAFVLQRQILHRKINTLKVATGYGKIAWGSATASQKNRVEIALKFVDGDINADVGIGSEADS